MHPHSFAARHRRLAWTASLVALAALPLGAAPSFAAQPAPQAQPSPVARYVALGDSYAAGQGGGGYVDQCLRSPLGYPGLIDQVPRFNLLRQPACSGATVDDVTASQLAEVNRGTTLVTITAGANDVGVGAVYAACAADPGALPCQQAIGAAQAAIPGVGPKIAGLVGAVRAASPDATIVVTGYPRPFSDALAGADPTAAAVNQATAALDAQIANAVQAQAAAGARVVFAPVSFGDHAIGGAALPWLGADLSDPISFLHPTAEGYLAYRDAVLAALP